MAETKRTGKERLNRDSGEELKLENQLNAGNGKYAADLTDTE